LEIVVRGRPNKRTIVAGCSTQKPGQSLNLTYNTNATPLILDGGGKDALTADQKQALSDDDFSEFIIP
jgi:hypothetical protein